MAVAVVVVVVALAEASAPAARVAVAAPAAPAAATVGRRAKISKSICMPACLWGGITAVFQTQRGEDLMCNTVRVIRGLGTSVERTPAL